MEKNRISIINTDKKEGLVDSCKSYLEKNNEKLFIKSLKKLDEMSQKEIISIINLYEIKKNYLSIEKIYSVLVSKDNKVIFIKKMLDDKNINFLDTFDIDYIKSRINTELDMYEDFKLYIGHLNILKISTSMKAINIIDEDITKKYHNYMKNENMELSFGNYFLEMKKVITTNEISLEECESFLNKMGVVNKKDITYQRSQSTEKIKHYKSYKEAVDDSLLYLEIYVKNIKATSLSLRFNGLSVKDFYKNLPKILPEFKKRIISQYLYYGFLCDFQNSASLISEIDYYLKIKNGINIKSISSFNNVLIKSSPCIIKNLLENLSPSPRDSLCHGIFNDKDFKRDSFIVFLVALILFYDESI